ncbi:MAG: restriction endonuclease subunit S [Spirochaetales bacterium]|nr:restriction endonuclease subunit S [Spirochaetales bacterium]
MGYEVKTLEYCVGKKGLFSDGDWVESKDQDPDGDVRLIQMADVGINFYKNKSDRYLTTAKFDELKCQLLYPGDILVSRMPDPIGRACIFPGDEKKCATVVDIAIIRVDDTIANNKFLCYRINAVDIRAKIEKQATGTTRKRISGKKLKAITIPLPPLNTQKKIVEILDTAQRLIDKRKEQIKEMDKLVQSLFYDMFGDPVTNPKGWEVKKLIHIVSGKYGVKAGPFGSSLKKQDYVKHGYRVYGQEQVIAGRFDIGDYYIDQEKFEKLKSCEIKTGDLLVSLVGSFGKILIVPNGIEKGIINPRLLKITLNNDLIIPRFFSELFKLPITQESLSSSAHGGTMGILNATILKDLNVVLPPISLQNTFAERVQAIEAQKEAMTKSLKQMEDNFNSLMQRAFKGELV